MTNLVDIRTLVLASGIIAVVFFVYMFHVQATRKTYLGFSLWTRGCRAAGVGLVLIALRGLVPDLLSIVVSGALILGLSADDLPGPGCLHRSAGGRTSSFMASTP